ncbi:hypothetical protein [Pseudoruegeria sp. HB172150]|uniref:hypothetical protein n=1 Tax=Pseudoruegeria sp. HB172150 TaxID=2721164 RepID=UPI001551FF6C|nr:hypothetical protein [Pseudoruegeria sp. HB172150]
MSYLRKSLNIAAIQILTSVALTGSAFAFTCEKDDGTKLDIGQKYADISMWHGNQTGKEIYIVNGEDTNPINEVQLLINDKSGNIVDRTVGEPEIDSSDHLKAVLVTSEKVENDDAEIGARFTMSWEEGYSLYVEVKWKGDIHYKRYNKDLDNGYAPFTFPVENGRAVNGMIVTRHSSGLGVVPLYDCE